MNEIKMTDSGQFVLDDILLEAGEVEKLGIDPADYKKKVEGINVYVKDKEVRRKYFDLFLKTAHYRLNESEYGGITALTNGKATAIKFLEALVFTCAIRGRINRLSGFLESREDRYLQDAYYKMKLLVSYEQELIRGISTMSMELFGVPLDEKAFRELIRVRKTRDKLVREVRKNFVESGKVEPI